MSPPLQTADAVALEKLFRQHYGRIVAALARRFGKQHFDLAEEAAQEALAKAARSWPKTGAPREPAAWLIATAGNYAIDSLRRDARFHEREWRRRALRAMAMARSRPSSLTTSSA